MRQLWWNILCSAFGSATSQYEFDGGWNTLIFFFGEAFDKTVIATLANVVKGFKVQTLMLLAVSFFVIRSFQYGACALHGVGLVMFALSG
jgi:hypothetical protein